MTAAGALDLIERARHRVQAAYVESDKARRFELLEEYLPGGQPTSSQADLGRELGLSEGAVKQEVFRLKRRFADFLREEVAHTVAHPDEVDDELRYLIDVLCRR